MNIGGRIWKEAKEVERLTVTRTKLGEGGYGAVYLGRVKFKDSKWKRVAVKIFRSSLSDHDAQFYDCAINDLATARVPMLKCGIVKHEGKWVIVHELYGATGKGSKLVAPFATDLKHSETRERLLDVVAKIANSGYPPHPDSINATSATTGHRFFVQDIDCYADRRLGALSGSFLRDDERRVAHHLAFWVDRLSTNTKKPKREILAELKPKIKGETATRAFKILETEMI